MFDYCDSFITQVTFHGMLPVPYKKLKYEHIDKYLLHLNCLITTYRLTDCTVFTDGITVIRSSAGEIYQCSTCEKIFQRNFRAKLHALKCGEHITETNHCFVCEIEYKTSKKILKLQHIMSKYKETLL